MGAYCGGDEGKPTAQIEFRERALDEHIRDSRFAGLRDDKQAREVTRESA